MIIISYFKQHLSYYSNIIDLYTGEEVLYGNETISYYSRTNIATWMLMALQAGLINIGGFMACHRFVSHVTGFATFFGNEVVQTNYLRALGMLIVPLFFLIGVMVSAILVDTRLRQNKKPKYYISFGLIFLLLITILLGGMAGYFGIFGEPLSDFRDYMLLTSLCFICGLQNGTITSVSKSVIRTTHLTGLTTDLGIGLIRILSSKKTSKSNEEDIKATLMRLGIIIFFGLGSVIGGYAFKNFSYFGFVIPVTTSGCLFIAMIYFQSSKKDFISGLEILKKDSDSQLNKN